MSDKNSNITEAERLLSLIAESVLEASDEEILSEAKARGENPDEVAAQMDGLFDAAVLSRKKERLKEAAARNEQKKELKSIEKLVFSKYGNAVEALNALVKRKTSMGTTDLVFQFKDFENMTENDAEKTLMNLIRLGDIDPEDL